MSNQAIPEFWVDAVPALAHKFRAMITATKKATTKTTPNGGSGGVRA